LSINTCNGPGGTEAGRITGGVSARRLTVLWSGAEIVRPHQRQHRRHQALGLA
jgi:hypothetical protein